ncbi:hypothetical protein [Microvirga sp. BSC39]|uniref:hypothetical protein n=1 Tax=Microvirga sp. BSC39 TaxID=1549810 RepID=UPI001269FB9C|nr:hypothetical protein [Microvirga sp. BSC39]
MQPKVRTVGYRDLPAKAKLDMLLLAMKDRFYHLGSAEGPIDRPRVNGPIDPLECNAARVQGRQLERLCAFRVPALDHLTLAIETAEA